MIAQRKENIKDLKGILHCILWMLFFAALILISQGVSRIDFRSKTQRTPNFEQTQENGEIKFASK